MTPADGRGIDRRRFLSIVGGATAGLALGGPAAACGAGPTRGGGIQPVGLQLYTVRSLMARDAAATLEQAAAVGYREVEFVGYFDHPPHRLAEILDANGLTAPSAHTPLSSLEGSALSDTLDAARTLGHRYLVVGWVPEQERRTLEDWRRLAERLEAAGERLADAGLRLAYHNHEFEFEPLEGAVPYDLIAGTDPDLVALQLDLYWVRRGGGDAAELLRRHAGRFPSVHVKDMGRDGGMVDVGSGVIDWPDLLERARAAGARHYFVEHDEPDDPLETIRRSYRYLSALE